MTDGRQPVLGAGRISVGIEELKAQHGPPPWAATLVRNDRYMVTAICQAPGHQNDWHYHLTDEYWSVYEGEICWTLEGRPEPVCVRAGEWIMAPANTYHLIEVRGEQPAIRIALLHVDEFHRHERADAPPPRRALASSPDWKQRSWNKTAISAGDDWRRRVKRAVAPRPCQIAFTVIDGVGEAVRSSGAIQKN